MLAPALQVNNVIRVLICFIIFFVFEVKAQDRTFLASQSFNDLPRGELGLRIVSYNVENLFDYFDDSLKLDDEFLPYKGRFWTKKRYQDKQQKLAQTIMAIGGWEPPGLIGLCEVENRYVLESLTKFTALKSAGYEIIHKDSPDMRGIDVALIYRPAKFDLLYYDFFQVDFPFDSVSKTRDILYAKGLLTNQDTLHVFMNHWPSKFGGEFETEPKRAYAAALLKSKMDSILSHHYEANIIAMGDFNDTPSAESLRMITTDGIYFNCMEDMEFQYGTHSFENEWLLIDQFIITVGLKDKMNATYLLDNAVSIYDFDFLLTTGALGNQRPFRTYQGPSYRGGYSDHLPIIMDLRFK